MRDASSELYSVASVFGDTVYMESASYIGCYRPKLLDLATARDARLSLPIAGMLHTSPVTILTGLDYAMPSSITVKNVAERN